MKKISFLLALSLFSVNSFAFLGFKIIPKISLNYTSTDVSNTSAISNYEEDFGFDFGLGVDLGYEFSDEIDFMVGLHYQNLAGESKGDVSVGGAISSLQTESEFAFLSVPIGINYKPFPFVYFPIKALAMVNAKDDFKATAGNISQTLKDEDAESLVLGAQVGVGVEIAGYVAEATYFRTLTEATKDTHFHGLTFQVGFSFL